jgi:hypothetical protein
MRESLHCAVHDEIVNSFGRDEFGRRTSNSKSNTGVLRCAQNDKSLSWWVRTSNDNGRYNRRSFDCGTHDGAVSAFAQDDIFLKRPENL